MTKVYNKRPSVSIQGRYVIDPRQMTPIKHHHENHHVSHAPVPHVSKPAKHKKIARMPRKQSDCPQCGPLLFLEYQNKIVSRRRVREREREHTHRHEHEHVQKHEHEHTLEHKKSREECLQHHHDKKTIKAKKIKVIKRPKFFKRAKTIKRAKWAHNVKKVHEVKRTKCTKCTKSPNALKGPQSLRRTLGWSGKKGLHKPKKMRERTVPNGNPNGLSGAIEPVQPVLPVLPVQPVQPEPVQPIQPIQPQGLQVFPGPVGVEDNSELLTLLLKSLLDGTRLNVTTTGETTGFTGTVFSLQSTLATFMTDTTSFMNIPLNQIKNIETVTPVV